MGQIFLCNSYETPVVEVVEVEVEKGFATTNEGVVENPEDSPW